MCFTLCRRSKFDLTISDRVQDLSQSNLTCTFSVCVEYSERSVVSSDDWKVLQGVFFSNNETNS